MTKKPNRWMDNFNMDKQVLEYMKEIPTLKDYKFDEDKYLTEIHKYILSTYNQHYAQSKYQATDTIVDAGYAEGFCMGNIQKYWKRYGKKEGKNRKDLLKIIHYAIIMLHVHDNQTPGECKAKGKLHDGPRTFSTGEVRLCIQMLFF